MGQVLHGSASTTAAVRRAIQNSQESLRVLAKRHGINPKTVAKWRSRSSTVDMRPGPKDAHSTVLSIEEEAIIVAFRKHTLLPLDDCLYALQATDPAPDQIVAAPLPATPRYLTLAARRRRQAQAWQVQHLPHRLLPHRYGRGSDRAGQALHVRGDRSDQQVCVCRVARELEDGNFARLLAAADQGGPLQDPHRTDRQWHPVHHAGRRRISRPVDQGSHG